MGNTIDMQEFQSRLQRLDGLLGEMERLADPSVRTRFREVVQAILDLHGIGLERLLEHVAGAGDTGKAILDACARDGVVSGLLLLHGLHPFDVETRVQQALESVRPALGSHGGNVELLDLQDGVVRLRLQGNCHHCPSSAFTTQQTIEEAIYGLAPEVSAIEVEGMPGENAEADRARVALPVLGS